MDFFPLFQKYLTPLFAVRLDDFHPDFVRSLEKKDIEGENCDVWWTLDSPLLILSSEVSRRSQQRELGEKGGDEKP